MTYEIRYQTKEMVGTQNYVPQRTEDPLVAMKGIITLLTNPDYKVKGYPLVSRGITTEGDDTIITFARVCTKTTPEKEPTVRSIFD